MNPQLLCIVNTAFTSGGSTTLQVSWLGSSDSSTFNTYVQGPAVAKADLTVGQQIALWPWPARSVLTGSGFGTGNVPFPRYFKLTYTVASGPFGGGKIFSAIILDRFAPIYYQPGFTVGT
jgi:hypothetical protein